MTRPYVIAIAGRVQQGKSTLLNCLLEKEYAAMGKGLATTRENSYFRYGFPESHRKNGDRWEYVCKHPLLHSVTLIDTPGFDANQLDDETAKVAIRESDAVLLVLAEKTLLLQDRAILDNCRKNGKRVIVLFNCRNQECLAPDQNSEICDIIDVQLCDYEDLILSIDGRRVLPCNLLWAWVALGHAENERKKIDRSRKLDDLPSLSDAELLAASRIPDIREALPTIFLQAIIRDPHREAERTAQRLVTLWSDRLERNFEWIFGNRCPGRRSEYFGRKEKKTMAKIKVVTESHVYGDDTKTINYVSPGELEKKLSELKETVSTLRSDVRAEIRELRKSLAAAAGGKKTKTEPAKSAPENRDAILQKMREDMKSDLVKMLDPLYRKIAAPEEAETPAGALGAPRKKTAKASESRTASGGDAALRKVAREKADSDTRGRRGK